MPLNYSKWDALELSDDSDIEGHPNVDHKSLVRWKQRDIHEKRMQRNMKIEALQAEIACNEVLLPRLRTITEDVHGADDGPAEFSKIVERLKTNPSPESPPTDSPNKISYDAMILSLLLQVYEQAKEKGVDKNDDRLRETLIAELKSHITKLGETTEKLKKDLEVELREKNKKITSENIHDGWDSHYTPPKPDPATSKKTSSKGKKETPTEFEVLNPKGVAAAVEAAEAQSKSDDEDADLPELTDQMIAFSKLPLRGYQESFEMLQKYSEIFVPGVSDALLVAAFNAESDGKKNYAKRCVHQSLLLQYCEKLGKDGVRLFFKRMTSGDPRAEAVFSKDVEDTYNHLTTRVVEMKKEQEAARANGDQEQIQLVPENPGMKISFNVPDGPPPEDLRIAEGSEGKIDVEQARQFLQLQWEVYDGFSEELKKALKSQSLEEVNKVLGAMKVAEAEEVVKLLDSAGILNFAEGGVRDETGRNDTDAKAE